MIDPPYNPRNVDGWRACLSSVAPSLTQLEVMLLARFCASQYAGASAMLLLAEAVEELLPDIQPKATRRDMRAVATLARSTAEARARRGHT